MSRKKFNVSDLASLDFKKMVTEDERMKSIFETLNDDQQEHVESFIEDIKSVFMPAVTNFGTALNEMTDEQREEFKESLEKLK